MSLKYPDILEHNNDNYALIDSNQIRGYAVVDTLSNRDTIALDKRKQGMIVSSNDTHDVYLYISDNVSNEYWTNTNNWNKIAEGGTDGGIENYARIYNTVAEIEALDSTYTFVLCNQTGLAYHYESSSSLVANNYNILNTSDSGDSRFIAIQDTTKEHLQVLTPLYVTTDNALISNDSFEYTIINDSYPELIINGMTISISENKNGACYVSSDNGLTAKSISNIEKGDYIYWNTSIACFGIDLDDYITLSYLI